MRRPYSQELRAKIKLVDPWLEEASQAVWNHDDLAELYPHLGCRIHSIIRASVPLMEAAEKRASQLASTDALARGLASYLREHIPEERNHDEWLLDDLQVLGLSREEVWARVPLPSVAGLVGSQYYWIFHQHPVAILGYIAVLEGNPPTTEGVEQAVARSGLPRAAFRTFFKHATLDVHHSADLDRVLDRLPFTREHSALMGISAIQTVNGLARSLTEMLTAFEEERANPQVHS